MQPDPTPDLDEIEKRHEYATSALEAVCKRDWKMRVSVPAKPNHDDDLVISASLQDIPWLLRAARERDELRVRAEKAEARAKELEALLSDAERVAGNAAAHWHPVEGPNLATVSGVECPGCAAEEDSSAALARIRAALAQKEPR